MTSSALSGSVDRRVSDADDHERVIQILQNGSIRVRVVPQTQWFGFSNKSRIFSKHCQNLSRIFVVLQNRLSSAESWRGFCGISERFCGTSEQFCRISERFCRISERFCRIPKSSAEFFRKFCRTAKILLKFWQWFSKNSKLFGNLNHWGCGSWWHRSNAPFALIDIDLYSSASLTRHKHSCHGTKQNLTAEHRIRYLESVWEFRGCGGG